MRTKRVRKQKTDRQDAPWGNASAEMFLRTLTNFRERGIPPAIPQVDPQGLACPLNSHGKTCPPNGVIADVSAGLPTCRQRCPSLQDSFRFISSDFLVVG
jgi:hypothetical protein